MAVQARYSNLRLLLLLLLIAFNGRFIICSNGCRTRFFGFGARGGIPRRQQRSRSLISGPTPACDYPHRLSAASLPDLVPHRPQRRLHLLQPAMATILLSLGETLQQKIQEYKCISIDDLHTRLLARLTRLEPNTPAIECYVNPAGSSSSSR